MKNSDSFDFVYKVSERPPWALAFLYSLQWVLLLLPALIMSVTLCASVFNFSPEERISFLTLTFVISGSFTTIQSLFGHKYPILEGPAMAHLLTILLLAPLGIEAIQGGMILGGIVLAFLSITGSISLLKKLFNKNIIIVILILIALAFIPHLVADMVKPLKVNNGISSWISLMISTSIIIFTVVCSQVFRGPWAGFSMLAGIVFGSIIYGTLGLLDFHLTLERAHFFSIPKPWVKPHPDLKLVAVVSFVISYVAVLINIMGSVTGVASVISDSKSDSALKRCMFINGFSGIVCGLFGIVGLVSYSISPGIIVLQKVASRYVLAICGVIIVIMGLFPKITAIFTIIPPSVVSSVLCVALGSQIGAALKMIRDNSFSHRDALVIGLSVTMGALVSVVPDSAFSDAPGHLRLILKNALIMGTLIALFFEHIVIKGNKKGESA